MPVDLEPAHHLLPVKGVRLAATYAGIRLHVREDMALVELAEGSTLAGVFTQNKMQAAPVKLARHHLTCGDTRYWLINAGNANAGTGMQGDQDALQSCTDVAKLVSCEPYQVLPFSTGVIGEYLPMNKITQGVTQLVPDLSENNWQIAAEAIMTTDTVAKGYSVQLEYGEKTVTITGIAKGAGMICPNMATMLAFITTDAAIPEAALQEVHEKAVNISFNRITVDGDTSTNDACVLAATGQSGVTISDNSPELNKFKTALCELYQCLATAVIRDAEGITKFITLNILNCKDDAEGLQVAYTVAHSPLVKTAFFASDANWGRILAAVGRAPIPDLVMEDIDISIEGVLILKNGQRSATYTEAEGALAMANDEIVVDIDLNRGAESVTVWTTDLSHDYIKINAEYRT